MQGQGDAAQLGLPEPNTWLPSLILFDLVVESSWPQTRNVEYSFMPAQSDYQKIKNFLWSMAEMPLAAGSMSNLCLLEALGVTNPVGSA